ncbi:hypothetical protein [Rhodococcus jostii]|uniref:hypothetical protein n=1 Tax=Rhodococcus jostii TaxID=132919 RepID=UPI000933BF44|nr:hypothetical protein [Rhodococcus jostii]
MSLPGPSRRGTVPAHLRRRNLADVRGPASRTRDAIRTGLARREDHDRIEVRIRDAEAAGLPLTLR